MFFEPHFEKVYRKYGRDSKMDFTGGFRKVGNVPGYEKQCRDPAHNPPGHIVLEPGLYEYKCPRCGKTTTIIIPAKPTLCV